MLVRTLIFLPCVKSCNKSRFLSLRRKKCVPTLQPASTLWKEMSSGWTAGKPSRCYEMRSACPLGLIWAFLDFSVLLTDWASGLLIILFCPSCWVMWFSWPQLMLLRWDLLRCCGVVHEAISPTGQKEGGELELWRLWICAVYPVFHYQFHCR